MRHGELRPHEGSSGATIKVSGTIKDHLVSPRRSRSPPGPAGRPVRLLCWTEREPEPSSPSTPLASYSSDLTVQHGYQGINNQEGTLTLTDSTVSGNTNPGEAYAGINNYGGGTMTIIDSTVAHNAGTATSAPASTTPGR